MRTVSAASVAADSNGSAERYCLPPSAERVTATGLPHVGHFARSTLIAVTIPARNTTAAQPRPYATRPPRVTAHPTGVHP